MGTISEPLSYLGLIPYRVVTDRRTTDKQNYDSLASTRLTRASKYFFSEIWSPLL